MSQTTTLAKPPANAAERRERAAVAMAKAVREHAVARWADHQTAVSDWVEKWIAWVPFEQPCPTDPVKDKWPVLEFNMEKIALDVYLFDMGSTAPLLDKVRGMGYFVHVDKKTLIISDGEYKENEA